MGPPWRTPLVSQGLCLTAVHAALATDMHCTGFPGTGEKPKGGESLKQQLLHGCVQDYLQCNYLHAGLIKYIYTGVTHTDLK